MQTNISLEEAQGLILQHASTLAAENILTLNALGRVSAADVIAPDDLPGRDQAAVDGFALSGLADAYQLTGAVKAGEVPLPLQPGLAIKVSTGRNLPQQTISVIPFEKTDIKNNLLYPREKVPDGSNIKKAGEDFPSGSSLFQRGTVIGAAEISLLAAFGIAHIEVVGQPRVAVLCLSRNVVAWLSEPEPGQIRDSNGPLLGSLVKGDGGIPIAGCTISATKVTPRETAKKLLEQADILIITGGTFAYGDNETIALMKELGAKVLYEDISVQPGSHSSASHYGGRLIIALSGNPGACAVGYHLFVAPALRALQGFEPGSKRINACCSSGFPKKSIIRRFIRGHLSWSEAGWQVEVLPGQKPSMIRSLLQCNALIDVPANSPAIDSCEEVSVIIIGNYAAPNYFP